MCVCVCVYVNVCVWSVRACVRARAFACRTCVCTLLPEEGGGRADTQAFRLALHGQDPRGSQAFPCSEEAGLHALLLKCICLFLVSLHKPSPSSLTFKGTA